MSRKRDIYQAQPWLQKTWKPTPEGLKEIALSLLDANGTCPSANKKARHELSINPASDYEENLFEAMFVKGGWYARVYFSVNPEYFTPIVDILFEFAACYLSRDRDSFSCEWIFNNLTLCIEELRKEKAMATAAAKGIDVQKAISEQYAKCISMIKNICTSCSVYGRPPSENEETFIQHALIFLHSEQQFKAGEQAEDVQKKLTELDFFCCMTMAHVMRPLIEASYEVKTIFDWLAGPDQCPSLLYSPEGSPGLLAISPVFPPMGAAAGTDQMSRFYTMLLCLLNNESKQLTLLEGDVNEIRDLLDETKCAKQKPEERVELIREELAKLIGFTEGDELDAFGVVFDRFYKDLLTSHISGELFGDLDVTPDLLLRALLFDARVFKDFSERDQHLCASQGGYQDEALQAGATCVLHPLLEAGFPVTIGFPDHHADHKNSKGFCYYSRTVAHILYRHRLHGENDFIITDFDINDGDGTRAAIENLKEEYPDLNVHLFNFVDQNVYPGSKAEQLCLKDSDKCSNYFMGGADTGTPKEACQAATLRIKKYATDMFEKITESSVLIVNAGFDSHESETAFKHDQLENALRFNDNQFKLLSIIQIAAKNYIEKLKASVTEADAYKESFIKMIGRLRLDDVANEGIDAILAKIEPEECMSVSDDADTPCCSSPDEGMSDSGDELGLVAPPRGQQDIPQGSNRAGSASRQFELLRKQAEEQSNADRTTRSGSLLG